MTASDGDDSDDNFDESMLGMDEETRQFFQQLEQNREAREAVHLLLLFSRCDCSYLVTIYKF